MGLPERLYNRNTGVACGYVPTAVPDTRERSSNRDGFGIPSEVLESAREAVYKECPGRAARDGAGVVELADARDSKSRVRKDVRVQVPPPAPPKIKQLRLTWTLRGGYKPRLCHETVSVDRLSGSLLGRLPRPRPADAPAKDESIVWSCWASYDPGSFLSPAD